MPGDVHRARRTRPTLRCLAGVQREYNRLGETLIFRGRATSLGFFDGWNRSSQDWSRLTSGTAGLPDLLLGLATALNTDRPVGRPTLSTCVDLGLIVDQIADPTPGLRLLAWAVCYEDVLVESDDLHEIRRVDADGLTYRPSREIQPARWRGYPRCFPAPSQADDLTFAKR
ncbi:hypothetical protein ACLQ24_28055 [Micromonospora sp. DT4]|uniref:hypothetical protein n=1 Tax=Micromonospora sp. DT4 TaxID=3393438 RepID=UPI003CF56BD6